MTRYDTIRYICHEQIEHTLELYFWYRNPNRLNEIDPHSQAKVPSKNNELFLLPRAGMWESSFGDKWRKISFFK